MPVTINSCASYGFSTGGQWPLSWEENFCLCCSGTNAHPAKCGTDNISCTPANLCSVSTRPPASFTGSLQAVYASKGTVSTSGVPDFGFGTGVAWTNPTNIANDNGSYATVTLTTTPHLTVGGDWSQYIGISNLGFNIPSGSWITGFGVAYKGHVDSTFENIDVFNVIIQSGGTNYYAADPSSAFGNGTPGYPSASYGSGQPLCLGCTHPLSFNTTDVVAGDAFFAQNGPYCQFGDDGSGGYFINGGQGYAPLHQPTLWSASEINSSTFGVAASFQVKDGSPVTSITLSLTGIAIAIYYVAPTVIPGTACGCMTTPAVGNPLID